MASPELAASLSLAHGTLEFPVFLPDATRGVVRSIDSADLENCGVTGLVMSTFHLMQHPGSSVIQAHGGLHRFTNWQHPIVTDSGGFQVYSLVRQNPKSGSLSEKGMVYRAEHTQLGLRLIDRRVRRQTAENRHHRARARRQGRRVHT